MIESRHIVVFGFGAQGSAQARNLFDGGNDVCVFLRSTSPRIDEVEKARIPLLSDLRKAAAKAEIAAILFSDGEQPALWNEIEDALPEKSSVIFAHGFNIHYRQIKPRTDLNIILVAPLAQGDTLRSDFVSGKGVPCQIAIAQDATGNAREIALEYARAIAGDGPFIETTFAEETETDLFAEQAVLCGGLFALIRAAFDTLVEKGYNPDIAYFCCLKEVRALANLVHENGISGSRERISDTALYGDLTRGPRIIDGNVKDEMGKILEEIRSGEFKDELLSDRKNGNPLLRRLLKQDNEHLIERIHTKFTRTTK